MTAMAESTSKLRSGLRGPMDRWYVTAPATWGRLVAGELVTLPVAVAHAKEMGTTHTACGIWSYSWRGMLELAFPLPPEIAPGVEMCPECIDHVIRGR